MAIKAYPAAKCPNYTHKKPHISPSTWSIPCTTFINSITVRTAAVASTDVLFFKSNKSMFIPGSTCGPVTTEDSYRPLGHPLPSSFPFSLFFTSHWILQPTHHPDQVSLHTDLLSCCSFLSHLFLLLHQASQDQLWPSLPAQALHCELQHSSIYRQSEEQHRLWWG